MTNTVIVRAIIHHKGKVLVIQRSDEMSRPGDWEVPGGKLEPGEDLEAGVAREVLEETGLDLKDYQYDKSVSYQVDKKARLGVVFHADSQTDKVKLNKESKDYRWVDASDYNNIEWDKHYQEFFDIYFATDTVKTTTGKKDYKDVPQVQHLIIYTDGGSRGNPGPSASGYVIMDENEEILEEGGEYLGITTNNQAEYQAVKLAIENAGKYGASMIDFYIDSLLVVNQMNGKFKIKNRDLWPIHESIKKMAQDFKEVNFTHVAREFNTAADAKVNEVLDSYNHRDTTPDEELES